MKIKFASKQCDGCRGTGAYAGRMSCKRCRGRGTQPTAQGRAARAYYDTAKAEAFRAQTDNVKTGDVLAFGPQRVKVESVADSGGYIQVTCTQGRTFNLVKADTVFIVDLDRQDEIMHETVRRFPSGAELVD